MTSPSLDQLLTDWQKNLDRASQNLLALQELTTYQRLAGEAGFSKVPVTGITASQVESALDALNQVFQHFDLLLATINRATALRQQTPRFLGGDQKNQEIEQLLLGQSIQLPVIHIPLAQRGLLSVAQTECKLSPPELLAMMTTAFDLARDTILAVDRAWSTLEPALAVTISQLQALEQQANARGLPSPPALALAQQAIAGMAEQIATDPLGVSQEWEQQIQPLVQQASLSLQTLIQQQQQVQASLATAQQRLAQLVDLNQQAIAAATESREKVRLSGSLPQPLDSGALLALKQWLGRLEAKFATGSLTPLTVGLENWTAQVKAAIATEQQTLAAHRSPVATRLELRGRLDALKAKALARGLAEDPMLTDLAERAKQTLYTRPTDLEQAMDWVRQYEKCLNQR